MTAKMPRKKKRAINRSKYTLEVIIIEGKNILNWNEISFYQKQQNNGLFGNLYSQLRLKHKKCKGVLLVCVNNISQLLKQV